METANNLEYWLSYITHPNTTWDVYTLQHDAALLAAEPNTDTLVNTMLILAKQYKGVIWC